MIRRFKENPLIYPNSQISWMTENAFNPGVIRDNEGRFHMLIRGGTNRRHQNCSTLGYATSEDGIHWSISPHPAIKCIIPETVKGVEDPRIVEWDNNYYIFATARHERYGRIGIWKTKDFLSYLWIGVPFDWESKAACIIPELINGKAHLIYLLYPNLWIAETRNVNLNSMENGKCLLQAKDITVDGQTPVFVELASPPVKLDGDWLVLFHVILEPYEHRVSYMILAGSNPYHIKYLHPQSILKPEMPWEKYGAVPYVCFLTGIVDMGDRFFVYWGSADSVISGGELLKGDIKLNAE